MSRTFLLNLQPNGIPAAALAQLQFDRFEQILRFFLVKIEIAVASYAKLISTLYLDPMEQSADMRLDKIADEDIAVNAALPCFVRKQSRQDPWHLDDR